MCRVSKVSDDWVVKGFHLHVYDIELVMRPDHSGGIVFKKLFHSTSDSDAELAIKRAKELLDAVEWRALFQRELIRARKHMGGEFGLLADLANGRRAEFTFLIRALQKLGIHEC